jgi:Mg/Co/Ni transporter MgtE
MSTVADPHYGNLSGRSHTLEERHERWNHWPVNWSAVWVGALTTIACLLLIGLIATAIGAHQSDPEHRMVSFKTLRIETAVFGVFGAFLAGVAGGWVASKIAGILWSEPAMLHGAIAWLITLPLLAILGGLGAANYLGGWHSGLVPGSSAYPGSPPMGYMTPATDQELRQLKAEETQYRDNVARWREETPKAVRNGAICAVTAVLLGLMGSVIGGWMACGEPMTFTHHTTRLPAAPAV